MLTALLYVWLQMSAQPQSPPIITDMVEERLHCQMGVCVEVPLDFDYTKINTTDLSPIHMILAQRAADETDGKPPKGPLTTQHNHIERGEFVEKVDVPAVQLETGESHSYCEYRTEHGVAIPFNQGTPSTCEKGGTLIVWRDKITTCKDKSRILEHDENSPPKYWCRKVQP